MNLGLVFAFNGRPDRTMADLRSVAVQCIDLAKASEVTEVVLAVGINATQLHARIDELAPLAQ